MKTLKAVALVMAVLFLFAAGSAMAEGKRIGDQADPKAPKVTLAQIIAKLDDWQGKTVTVEGTLNGACGDGDFYFKDKFNLIEFELSDAARVPEVDKLKKGTRVRLYGVVKVRRSGSGEAHVRVVAKGVEVL